MMWLWFACSNIEQEVTPRTIYNDGIVLMEAGSWSDAEAKFLEARDQARTDQGLRAAAAYNLGLTYVRDAQSLEEQDPELAQEQYDQAIAWFRDVIHLQGDSADDARHNLEVALKARQGLVDRLTQGENGFSERLGRFMEAVQMSRKSVQELIWRMDRHGDRERPAGYEKGMTELAVHVRELGADGLEIANLAADEILRLEQIPEAERTPEDSNKLVMMQLFLPYMDLGREEIFNARRQLRRLNAMGALEEFDDSLQLLIRAKDQLLSPEERLQSLVNSQSRVTRLVEILDTSPKGTFRIDDQAVTLPSWMTNEWVADQEAAVLDRTEELRLYLHLWSQSLQANPEATDMFLMNNIDRATAEIDKGIQAMKQANDALATNNLSSAIEHVRTVYKQMLLAWENFADVKTIVEWTHRDNEMMKRLLEGGETIENTHPTELEREEAFQGLRTQNLVRLERLDTLLVQAKMDVLKQAEQQGSTDDEQLEKIEQMHQLAQLEREHALEALNRIGTETVEKDGVLEELNSIEKSVRVLRLMFFTVIEHLEDVAQQQEELWQHTGTGITESDDDILIMASLWNLDQSDLRDRTDMVSTELQRMADEMAVQGDTQKSEALGDAFVETGVAMQFMQDAMDGLAEFTEDATTSHDPSEIVDAQQQALEALLRAIQALQPPQQGDQGQEDGEQDQQEQNSEQQQPQEPSGDMSEREAQRKMQAAKEKEAKRDQDKQEAAVTGGFVEKDW